MPRPACLRRFGCRGIRLQSPRPGRIRIRPADGMEMVYVPAGEFLMGSTEAQLTDEIATCVAEGNEEAKCKGWFQREMPQHAVYLDAFWIDRTEVTNRQFKEFVDAGGKWKRGGHPGVDGGISGGAMFVTWMTDSEIAHNRIRRTKEGREHGRDLIPPQKAMGTLPRHLQDRRDRWVLGRSAQKDR